jgi:hypothetical protein
LLLALGCGKDPEGPGSGGGPVSTTYDITLRFVRTPLPHHQSAVDDAATLWERVITGDIPPLAVTPANGGCGSGTQGQNETIDDILIWIRIEPIDGPNGVLGQGGPCAIRSSSGLPAVGLMILDSADMTLSLMRRVIIHEMGHALGFGTAWANRGLLVGGGGTDPTFSGSQALTQFNAVGGTLYNGAKVPVENTGGAGTQDAHWRESVFGNEVMTGFISSATDPLSKVSVASMGDLGYAVNVANAELYVLPPLAVRQPSEVVALGDDVLRLPVKVIDDPRR